MGMAYFYLGDLDGAEYYHNRMVNGVTEPSRSLVRLVCVNKFLKQKFNGKPCRSSSPEQSTGSMSTPEEQSRYEERLARLFVNDPERRAEMLYADVRHNTKSDEETPRITPVAAAVSYVESCAVEDLPSPRRSYGARGDDDSCRGRGPRTAGRKKDGAASLPVSPQRAREMDIEEVLGSYRHQQSARAVMAKLKQITADKTVLRGRDMGDRTRGWSTSRGTE